MRGRAEHVRSGADGGTYMETPTTAPGTPAVPVTRPIAVRQLAAGLATAAALVVGSGLGLSLDTVEYGATEFSSSSTITRLAWGEQLTPQMADESGYPSVTWGGPLVVAVVLLAAAAVCALLAARGGDRGPWDRLAQLL